MNTLLHNIRDVYFILTAISAVVILTLAFLLTSVHLPQGDEYRKFNQARFFLALSYLILGGSGVITCFMPSHAEIPSEMLLITAGVASFQSLLFTATHIVFIQPSVLNKKNLLKHVFGILTVIVLLTEVYLKQLLSVWLFQGLIFAVYLLQQTYYTYRFRQLHIRCEKQMVRYYDEEQKARLKWVNYSFFSALTIGLLSLLSSVCGLGMYVVFIVLYTLFYTYIVVLVYNNKLITEVILPAVANPTPVTGNPTLPTSAGVTDAPQYEAPYTALSNEEQYKYLHDHLSVWIAEKGYLQKDLSVDEIACTLGVSRDYLRFYFRTYIHNDFRTWRSELRISEAKNIMKKHPEYSFTHIAEMVGFNHRSNFFNQFQKLEGMTPSEWRDLQTTE